MMKFLQITLVILIIPVWSLCQDNNHRSFHGTMIIGEKPVIFNSLTTPDGTTDLMYFNLLPTKNTYDSLLEKNSVSFVDLEQVIIKRLSSAETDFVRDSCPGCTFYRAWISLRNQPGETAKLVYLDLKYITWKNTETGEFSEPRSAELKYLDAIYFRDDIRK